MNIGFLAHLHATLPNMQLSDPVLGACNMVDTNGDIMGHVDLSLSRVFIDEGYEHAKLLQQQLTGKNIPFELKLTTTDEEE